MTKLEKLSDAGASRHVDAFASAAEPLRRELMAYCYRMLGSVEEAEDLVQETYLRAWRSFDRFEGRSSMRRWLYRIATNVCLTELKQRHRRVLPSGLGSPSDEPDALPASAGDVAWLQPIPDALVAPASEGPAEIVAGRESLRIALIASLQYLPPRQRAIFILRDVLTFPAVEVASLLDTTPAAIKSALQRARTRLGEAEPGLETLVEPTEARARALLHEYIVGFENADTAALERALRTDAAIELVGTRTWFSGRTRCLRYLTQIVGSSGSWRIVTTRANGQVAGAAYGRSASSL
jgi:RNA polymerase sigma-70 factor (ECF subfamily)